MCSSHTHLAARKICEGVPLSPPRVYFQNQLCDWVVGVLPRENFPDLPPHKVDKRCHMNSSGTEMYFSCPALWVTLLSFVFLLFGFLCVRGQNRILARVLRMPVQNGNSKIACPDLAN